MTGGSADTPDTVAGGGHRGPRTLVVGRGRAGESFARALRAAGWHVDLCSHGDAPASAVGHDLVMLCVPDAAVAPTAATIPVDPDRVVAHCAGSLGVEVLEGHPRRASVHPLASLPDGATGADRLRGAWFAVSGDALAASVVEALGGRTVEVDDDRRAAYHATAVVASNHLVALVGQVERLAEGAGVPPEAFADLASDSLANALAMGAATALTGPVARGDWATVARHLDAIDPAEREAYLAMAAAAARLAGTSVPSGLGGTVEP